MIFYSTWYLGTATSASISYEVGTLRTQRDLGLAVGLRALILECANRGGGAISDLSALAVLSGWALITHHMQHLIMSLVLCRVLPGLDNGSFLN
jgi:hypothetical protein